MYTQYLPKKAPKPFLKQVLLVSTLASSMLSGQVFAWAEHSLITYPVLKNMPEVMNAAPVKAEVLSDFLDAEGEGIVELLAQDELWLRENMPYYMPRPDALAFKNEGTSQEKVAAFVKAIRINPDARLAPFLQLLPNEAVGNRTRLASSDVAVFSNLESYDEMTFVDVKSGDYVLPAAVIITGNDEPDNGLDNGLFEDNHTEAGKIYGFGKQAFGDPNLEYGSQAPFHMGFFHEDPLLFKLAPYLHNTFPHYRVHVYKQLAEYAFATGHDYWGWRFMGWGAHYIGDISQPYHARMQPGVGTWGSIWMNAKYMVGLTQSQTDGIQLLSNRHMLIETVQNELTKAAYINEDFDSPIFAALDEKFDDVEYSEDTFIDFYAKKSYDKADTLDESLTKWAPEKLVSDPSFELNNSPESLMMLKMIDEHTGQEGIAELTHMIADLMADHNVNIRSYIYSTLEAKGETQANAN